MRSYQCAFNKLAFIAVARRAVTQCNGFARADFSKKYLFHPPSEINRVVALAISSYNRPLRFHYGEGYNGLFQEE
jgi:hypothetical protein